MKTILFVCLVVAIFLTGYVVGNVVTYKKLSEGIFELRELMFRSSFDEGKDIDEPKGSSKEL